MSYLLNLSITLFNQELDPDAILRVVMPRGVAEHKPLPHIGGQGDFIREIKIGLKGDGTAIDERVSNYGESSRRAGICHPS